MAGYSVTFSVVDQATAQIEAINRRVRQMREPLERQSRAVQRFMDVSGLRRMADGFGDLGRRVVGVFSSMSRLVPVLGALTGAASIAGMTRLVGTWGQFGLQLQRDATRIGTTSQNLQQLQTMTRLAGGSADDMTESLKGLSAAAADAITGRNVEALAWFNRANIDVNAALHDTTQTLPKVLEYIAGLKNPTDQMTAAMGLGGQSLYKLVQTFREAARPQETLIDTYRRLSAAAERYTTLSDRQIAAQRRYKEAVDALNVTMDMLGQQVGTVLAEAFEPLIREFGAFVQDHQPEIIRAVRELAEGFSDWLKGVDVEELMENLRGLAGLLRDILRIVVALAKALAPIISILTLTPRKPTAQEILAGSPLAAAVPEAEQARILEAASARGETREVVPGFGDIGRLGLGTWAKQRLGFGRERVPITPPSANAGAPRRLSGNKQEFIERTLPLAQQVSKQTGVHPHIVLAQAALESNWGRSAPNQNYFGIKGPGGVQTTQEYEGGRFVTKQQSFAGYGSIEESFQGYADFINKNPRYRQFQQAKTPEAQLAALGRSGYATDPAYAQKIASIVGSLPSVPAAQGGETQLAAAEGRPVEVTGGPSVSGAVDITVTHKNPPPGATVTATGTGEVNLATPRTEQQALAAA